MLVSQSFWQFSLNLFTVQMNLKNFFCSINSNTLVEAVIRPYKQRLTFIGIKLPKKDCTLLKIDFSAF